MTAPQAPRTARVSALPAPSEADAHRVAASAERFERTLLRHLEGNGDPIRVILVPAARAGTAMALLGGEDGWVIEAGVAPAFAGRLASATPPERARWAVCVRSATILADDCAESFVRAVCDRLGMPPERSEEAVQVVTELVANAVLHGNLGDHAPATAPPARLGRAVAVLAGLVGARLSLAIVQEGGRRLAPDRASPRAAQEPDQAKSTGRGLLIARALSAALRLEEDGRTWTAEFDLPAR